MSDGVRPSLYVIFTTLIGQLKVILQEGEVVDRAEDKCQCQDTVYLFLSIVLDACDKGRLGRDA